MRLNQATASLITAILLISLTSCGDDTPESGTDPTPTAPTSSATRTPEPTATPTPVTDKEKAAAALMTYLEVRDEMYRTMKVPNDIEAYVTDSNYYSIQKQLLGFRTAGYEFEGEWGHEVIAVKKDKLTGLVVADCEDRTSLDARLPNGKPIKFTLRGGGEQPIRARINYRVIREGDRWLVDSVTTGTFPPC